jgi:hypothetical protein
MICANKFSGYGINLSTSNYKIFLHHNSVTNGVFRALKIIYAAGGPAVGAAIGAASGLIGKGKSVEMPAGTLFEFRLMRPDFLKILSRISLEIAH